MNAAPAVIDGGMFMSRLSVPRTAASFWRVENSDTVARLCAAGLDIAEIRLDLAQINNLQTARELITCYAPLPTILTIRPSWEGGQWQKDEAARQQLFVETIPLCAAVDIELAAAIRPHITAAAKAHGKALIISRHNLAAADSLADMETAAQRAFAAGADVFKNACMVNTAGDLAVLQSFLQRWKERPVIIIGMGETEVARRARLELPAQGSRIAFAAIGENSAPGQLSLAETVAAIK